MSGQEQVLVNVADLRGLREAVRALPAQRSDASEHAVVVAALWLLSGVEAMHREGLL